MGHWEDASRTSSVASGANPLQRRARKDLMIDDNGTKDGHGISPIFPVRVHLVEKTDSGNSQKPTSHSGFCQQNREPLL